MKVTEDLKYPEHKEIYYPINYGYVEEKWGVALKNKSFSKVEIITNTFLGEIF